MASGMALLISLGLLVLRWRLGTVQARRFVLRDANRRLVAQLTAGYNGGELELRDASGEIAVVLGDGLRLREKTAGRAWTSTTEEGETRASLHLDGKGRPQFELEE
jgi:hypothetical protein